MTENDGTRDVCAGEKERGCERKKEQVWRREREREREREQASQTQGEHERERESTRARASERE